jgi:hypothetical protein
MTTRAAVLLSIAFVFSALPARAQGPGPGGPPPSYQQLVSQLADLQARVARLEGNITAADLAGTYTALIMDITMDGFRAGGQSATITTDTTRASLTLNADGTGSGSGFSCEQSTLTLATGALSGGSCGEGGSGGEVTWTYANGVATITFLDDGDQIPFTVAAGGRLLIVGGSFFHDSDQSSNHLQFILTRLR